MVRIPNYNLLRATPVLLVLGRDMLLPSKFKVNWQYLKARTSGRDSTQATEIQDSEKCTKVVDKLLLTDSRKRSKLAPPRKGPYQVECVFANGTLLI
jgi:hypothetical protein